LVVLVFSSFCKAFVYSVQYVYYHVHSHNCLNSDYHILQVAGLIEEVIA